MARERKTKSPEPIGPEAFETFERALIADSPAFNMAWGDDGALNRLIFPMTSRATASRNSGRADGPR